MSEKGDEVDPPKNPCKFCRIARGEAPCKVIEFENNDFVIIEDIRPASEHHFLAISKEHIKDPRELRSRHKPMLVEMEEKLKETIRSKGGDSGDATFGFHWPPFTSVNHLHMHGIAPASKMGFLHRWMFKPINIWYCTPQYVAANMKPDCRWVNTPTE